MSIQLLKRSYMLCSLFSALLIGICPTALAATLEVGPGKQFNRIEQAVSAAEPGDIVEVHPRLGGKPYERVGVFVDKPRLTIRAAGVEAGQHITLSGKGFEHSGRGRTPRAIFQFNRGADHCVLEGFELTGASNNTRNGAGVRINQANHVTIRNCDIHNNDMGIMSNGDGTLQSAVNQRIENCAIHHNGDHESPRFHHNVYLGGTSATVRFCNIHHVRRGHNIKSRAHFTKVEYSYVHHSPNREFDLVDATDTTGPGSHAVLLGNIIVKDPHTQGNRGVIHFGQDGGREHDGTLYLVHNTIVTPFVSPVIGLSSAKARSVLFGNIIDDGGKTRNNQTLGDARRGGASVTNISGVGNWLAPGFAAKLEQTNLEVSGNIIAGHSQKLYVNPQQHDYRLRNGWPGIVRSGRPLNTLHLPPTPGAGREEPPLRWQYLHPLNGKPRATFELPDLGAHEFTQM
jgi:hypothetical protein